MKIAPDYQTQLIHAKSILEQIVIELGITNVRCFGFYKNKWVVKYMKGKQNKFETFDDMYNFLKTESNDNPTLPVPDAAKEAIDVLEWAMVNGWQSMNINMVDGTVETVWNSKWGKGDRTPQQLYNEYIAQLNKLNYETYRKSYKGKFL